MRNYLCSCSLDLFQDLDVDLQWLVKMPTVPKNLNGDGHRPGDGLTGRFERPKSTQVDLVDPWFKSRLEKEKKIKDRSVHGLVCLLGLEVALMLERPDWWSSYWWPVSYIIQRTLLISIQIRIHICLSHQHIHCDLPGAACNASSVRIFRPDNKEIRHTFRVLANVNSSSRSLYAIARSWEYSTGQKTVFTHSAITPPKVNRFGLNLEHF